MHKRWKRYLSKNWLNQSTFHFQKILDSIILLFLNKDIDYIKQGNHLFIQKEYNTKSIIQDFRYVKNLVLMVSFLILDCYSTSVSLKFFHRF